MDKTKNNKMFYLLIFIVAIFSKNICPLLFPADFRYIVFFIWLSGLVVVKLTSNREKKYRKLGEKCIWLGIIITVYYCLYFLLGVFEGFLRNPVSFKLDSIINKLVFIIGARFCVEVIRTRMTNKNNTLVDFIIISIIFAFYELDYKIFKGSLTAPDKFVEYIGKMLIPIISRSLVLTYLSKIGGIKLNFIFLLANSILELFIPITPKMDWFLVFAKEIIICIIVYMVMNSIEIRTNLEYTKRDLKKQNILSFVPAVGIVALLVCFVVGLFPYRPVAVMSNSMVPEFYRGDFIIVEKFDLETQKPGDIKLGDIIQYNLDGKLIVHRVVDISIDYNGVYLFRTKGDNNNGKDGKSVKVEQIDSIVRAKIPYLGYPSVWFNENVLNNPSWVDTE